ncbi:MAG TPA: hypothetical protein VIL49_18380, partial [Capillimicrobium sp.]
MTAAVRRALALPVALLAFAALAAGAPVASAAEYTVHSCRAPDSTPLPADAWRPGGNAGARSDTCLTGGTLSAWLGPADAWGTAVSGFRFALPAGLQIVRYRVFLDAQTSSTTVPGSYRAGVGQFGELSPAIVDHGCAAPSASCAIAAPGGFYIGDTMTWPQLAVLAICPEGATCDPSGPTPARVDLYRSEVDLDDGSTPTVGAIGGTVAAGATVRGTRSVRAPLTDAGAGVRRAELLVDGAPVADQVPGGRCAEPYTLAAPCPAAMEAAIDLDTTTLADGPHTVAIRVTDAAGNDATSAALPIVVDNTPTPPVLVPMPVEVPVPVPGPPAPPVPLPQLPVPSEQEPPPPPARLALTAPGRVEPSRERPVRGRLATAAGAAKPGVRVTFERRPIGGDDDEWRPFGQATSDADGRFAVPDPKTSGEVRIVVDDASFSAPATVVRFVEPLETSIEPSAERLRADEDLVLRGRFEHAGGALDEQPILVQAIVRGRWRTVDSVEADAQGRVEWAYAFTNTTRTALYRFRFVLPAAKRLPWKRLATDAVEVRVE